MLRYSIVFRYSVIPRYKTDDKMINIVSDSERASKKQLWISSRQSIRVSINKAQMLGKDL